MTNKIVRLLAGFGFVVVLFKLLGDESLNLTLQNLREMSVGSWLVLFSLSGVVLLFLSILFLISIRVVDKSIPFGIGFGYTSMNSFFNTVLPLKGGLWIRGMFLKRHFNLAWKHYLFLVVSSQLIHIIVLSACFLWVLAIVDLDLSYDLSALEAYSWLSVVLLCFLFGLWFFRKTNMVTRGIGVLRIGFKMWFKDPRRLSEYLFMTVALHALTGFRLWYCFYLVGYTFNIAEMVALYTALAVGLSWGFTPGNIGVKEAAIVVLASMLGSDPNTALSASIIDRIASMLVITLVGGVAALVCAKSSEELPGSQSNK